MLSLLSVLGIFVILGVCPSSAVKRVCLTCPFTTPDFSNSQLFVVRNRRSSDEKLFVRTHVAIYFFSLLICNLIQAIGALFNIAWIVEERVYTGTVCTAQAVIEQTASVRGLLFYGGDSVLTYFTDPGRDSNFLLYNRRPQFYPTVF